MTNKRNLWLDLFKLCMCWMIISIHFVWDTYWYYPIYRLAVPLFFAISGYFNYRADAAKRLSGALTFIKRSAKYMVLGFSFYILFDFVMCYVDGKGVGYYFTTLFYENILFDFFFLNRPITYSGAQLWFLIALFVVSLVHYALVRLQKERWYLWIVPIGLAIQIFFGEYMRLFQETDMPIRYTRNAWFNGLPFFGLGYLLAQRELHKKRWYTWLYLPLAVVFTLLQIPEGHWLKAEVYASTIPAVIFTLLFFLGLPSPPGDWYYKCFGKNMPFYIYILHMAVGIVVGRLWSFTDLFLRSLVILGVSIVIYEIYYWASIGIRRLRKESV